MVTPAVPTRGFNCGNCGAAIELRALTHTQTVVCSSCAAVVDPRDPNVFVIQQAALRQRITPTIPLGARGTWHGQPYEVVGFQRRSIEVDDTRYWWQEYVLFNPYRGFRYLSEYQGHWNDIRTVRALIEPEARSRPQATHGGHTFLHFQKAVARTDFVLGEFPWRVTVGEVVTTDDYVAPPLMLSSEATDEEVTWSLGEYTAGAAVFAAFGVPGTPPAPVGVFANQPNPHVARTAGAWRAFKAFAALLLLLFFYRIATADRQTVLEHRYTYQPTVNDSVESAFVTETFTLPAPGNLEVDLHADVTNAWLGLDLALINLATGEARNVSKEIEYYTGRDSDGTWSEGDQDARLVLSPVPAGEYYLRVDPDSDAAGNVIPYTIRLRRDVPTLLPYGLAFVLLLIPPIRAWLRSSSFESARLAEGDYGSSSSDDDDSDSDDE